MKAAHPPRDAMRGLVRAGDPLTTGTRSVPTVHTASVRPQTVRFVQPGEGRGAPTQLTPPPLPVVPGKIRSETSPVSLLFPALSESRESLITCIDVQLSRTFARIGELESALTMAGILTEEILASTKKPAHEFYKTAVDTALKVRGLICATKVNRP